MRARWPEPVPGRSGRPRARCGFTLIEMMMVLAILGILVGVGLPAMISTVRKGPMRQAVADLEEGFLKARMLAILTGQPAELLIRAGDGTLQVQAVNEAPPDPAAGPGGVAAQSEPPPPVPEAVDDPDKPRPEPLPSFSAKLDPSVAFKRLDVSLRDMMDEPQAAVRFYPNGTCDAFAATLVSDAGGERNISLEITTGRARVEVIR